MTTMIDDTPRYAPAAADPASAWPSAPRRCEARSSRRPGATARAVQQGGDGIISSYVPSFREARLTADVDTRHVATDGMILPLRMSLTGTARRPACQQAAARHCCPAGRNRISLMARRRGQLRMKAMISATSSAVTLALS